MGELEFWGYWDFLNFTNCLSTFGRPSMSILLYRAFDRSGVRGSDRNVACDPLSPRRQMDGPHRCRRCWTSPRHPSVRSARGRPCQTQPGRSRHTAITQTVSHGAKVLVTMWNRRSWKLHIWIQSTDNVYRQNLGVACANIKKNL